MTRQQKEKYNSNWK